MMHFMPISLCWGTWTSMFGINTSLIGWQHYSAYLISRSPSRKRRSRNSPMSSSGASPKRIPGRSPPRNSLEQKRGRLSRSPSGSPVRKAPEPSTSNHERGLSRSTSPNGTPKRIRKGRGFTDQYAFARRYRTPSPERSRGNSYRYGGRDIYRSNRDR